MSSTSPTKPMPCGGNEIWSRSPSSVSNLACCQDKNQLDLNLELHQLPERDTHPELPSLSQAGPLNNLLVSLGKQLDVPSTDVVLELQVGRRRSAEGEALLSFFLHSADDVSEERFRCTTRRVGLLNGMFQQEVDI